MSPVFRSYGVRRAVLFGSVTKGTHTEKSDLDVLVDSRLTGLRFVGLLEALQQVTGMRVDLLDVSHLERGSTAEEEIERSGVVIYEE
ncbi:MAG: nucleotidyltransferase domain-containing protein [Clostridia bacterium]|nr:nucleotidyltransferase domain-containing protein [Clostridia bacterium]